MPTVLSDNTRSDPPHSVLNRDFTPTLREAGRVVCEASRRAELDRIRLGDIKRRRILVDSVRWEALKMMTSGLAMISCGGIAKGGSHGA